ncbi:MAG TPA: hypothetical protein VGQ81_02775 [Acidobacteriota bacterium]|nr:hypothetical protein [Acidobacteriota bacterium]
MKRLRNIVIYALLALVALFTKACDCDNEKDPPVTDVYCVQLETQSVTLKEGESKDVKISDGGCDSVTPALPWDKVGSGQGATTATIQNANSANGASIHITRTAKDGDIGKIYSDGDYWIIRLAGPGIPNHDRRVYGGWIDVRFLTGSSEDPRSEQQFKILISAAPPLLRFTAHTLQRSGDQFLTVVNRSADGRTLEVTTGGVEGGTSGSFEVSPTRFTLNKTQTVRIAFTAGLPGTAADSVKFSARDGSGNRTSLDVPLVGVTTP